jgi:hypothetical protein
MMDIAIIATDLALYFKWVFLLTLIVAVWGLERWFSG